MCRVRWTKSLPTLSKPKMSLPTELVRPVSISCLCRNSLCRACPLPLSSSPCVNTPSRVDLPASTLPTTATLHGRTKVRIKWNQIHDRGNQREREMSTSDWLIFNFLEQRNGIKQIEKHRLNIIFVFRAYLKKKIRGSNKYLSPVVTGCVFKLYTCLTAQAINSIMSIVTEF